MIRNPRTTLAFLLLLMAASAASLVLFIGNDAEVAVAAPQSVDVSIGVSKDRPELVDILNEGFRSLTLEEPSEISNRWLTVRYDVG